MEGILPRSLHTGLQTYGLSVLAALGIAVATPVGGAPPPEDPPWIEAVEQLAPQTGPLHTCYQAALSAPAPALGGIEAPGTLELQIQIHDQRGQIEVLGAEPAEGLRDCVTRVASAWDYSGLEDTRFVWPVQLVWVD